MDQQAQHSTCRVSILVFVDLFATSESLQDVLRLHYERFNPCFRRPFCNSDTGSLLIHLESFNPCFRRPFCNQEITTIVHFGEELRFQSLFSQTFLQHTDVSEEEAIAMFKFQSLFSQTFLQLEDVSNDDEAIDAVSILVFVDLFATLTFAYKPNIMQIVVSILVFVDLFATFLAINNSQPLRFLVSILVFVDLFATQINRGDKRRIRQGFNPCFRRPFCNYQKCGTGCTRWWCFNPCFRRPFCNLTIIQTLQKYKRRFQSLFSQTFLQLETVRCDLRRVPVSILVFVDLFAT